MILFPRRSWRPEAKKPERLLTKAEYRTLADVPPEAEWFANIENPNWRSFAVNAQIPAVGRRWVSVKLRQPSQSPTQLVIRYLRFTVASHDRQQPLPRQSRKRP